jgi:hypothetical protein
MKTGQHAPSAPLKIEVYRKTEEVKIKSGAWGTLKNMNTAIDKRGQTDKRNMQWGRE